MFIEKNFETIIKVWIIICVGARIFFKDIYVLYMHIIGIFIIILIQMIAQLMCFYRMH